MAITIFDTNANIVRFYDISMSGSLLFDSDEADPLKKYSLIKFNIEWLDLT